MSGGICRLCCKNDNVLLEVFVNVKEEISLAAKIFVCFGVKIQEDDTITKRICKTCYFFTNSAYEYRISAQQNDVKLKKAYEEAVQKEELIPRTISQDAFLSTFHLANKNNIIEKPKVRQYHPSAQRLKRKYPDINIPPSFHRINIDPIVLIDRSDIDQWNGELTNLGIWAVNRKKFKSQTGVTLTRVRRKSVDYVESSDTSERSTPAKRKKKKKKVLWCEPKSKSLRFTLRRKSKSTTNVTTNKENKRKIPTEETDEESVDSTKEIEASSVVDVQPRLTRSAAKFSDSAKKSFGEIIRFSKEPNNSVENIVNTESDGNDELPNLEKIINESFQNLGSKKCTNTGADGYEKHSNLNKPINEAVQNKQLSDNDSTTKLKSQLPNQIKISPVQTLSDQILSTNSLLDDDTDSVSTNNDGDNLFMVVGQEVTTYICQTCNQVFDSLALLNSHKKYSHRSSLRCSRCSKKFAVVESLVRHEIAAHSEVQKKVTPENDGSKMSQLEINSSEIIESEDNDAEMIQPENNTSEISQPKNATSVIRKIEDPIKTVHDCLSPIFEMLPATSASVVRPIENPISKICETNNPTSKLNDSETLPSTSQWPSSAFELPDKANSKVDIKVTYSKPVVPLGNPEGSQGSSQNSDTSKKYDKKMIPRYIPPILKHVARKSTARNNLKRIKEANETRVKKDMKVVEECVISSDDDVEIMSVVRKLPVIQSRLTLNKPATESSLGAVVDTALQAQLKQMPEVNLNETTATENTPGGLLEKALQPQILTEADNESRKNTAVDARQKNVKLREDQVLLIVESDPEDDSVMFVPNDEAVHPKIKGHEAGPSNSKKENLTNEIRQRITMITNPQEKRATTNSSVTNTNNSNNKITNETNYINYILNKCRYSDKVAISEQKWILKDLQTLLNRNYVPVEVEFSNVNEVTTSYVVPPTSTKVLTNQTHAYWNYERAIKLPAKQPELPYEQPKTNVPDKGVISSNLSPVSPNSMMAIPVTSMAAISTNKTVPISTNNMEPISENSKVPVSANSKVPISANNMVPITANNMVPISENSKVPISANSKVPISANNKVPISENSKAQISANNKVPILANNKVVSSKNGKVPISSNSKVFTSSGSNVSMPSTYKVPIPRSNRVTVPSTIVTVPYANGQTAVTNSVFTSPNTSVSQNQSPNAPIGKGDHINLIYILESSPIADSKDLALNTNTGTPQLNENNANKSNDLNQQKNQILLSGVPYPNYAKIQYDNLEPGQPILLRQIMAQPTNVNIQNFVSVSQTNIASTSTGAPGQYISTPVIMPVNQTNPSVNCNAPMSNPPGASNESDLKPKDSVTKPTIRIKDLSELTGKPSVSIEDRNMLHGFYSNTVHNYISNSRNNFANSSKANNTDEFMQIS